MNAIALSAPKDCHIHALDGKPKCGYNREYKLTHTENCMKNVFERAAGRAADSAATDFRAGSHFPARLMARALFWLLPLTIL